MLACLLLPAVARGSAADVFGLSAEESAVAGASSARVHDFSAAYYDPARLTVVSRAEFSAGVLGMGSQLHIDLGGAELHPQVEGPVGITVGAIAPVPLGSFLRDRLYVGIALYIPTEGIARVIAHRPDEPFFPYYDNRTQRLVVLPALAVRLPAGLSVGVAFNFLAGLGGNVESSPGATRAIEPRVDEQITSTLKVNVGLSWRSPSDRWSAALVYRQAFSVPFSTVTQNLVAGQPIDLDIAAEGLYTPDEIVVGGAARVIPSLLLSADLTASLWSRWQGPFVAVGSELPIIGPLDSPLPVLHYDDTVSIRVGAEYSHGLSRLSEIHARLGYGFETSPIPADQPGVTNLLDGDKHFLGAGLGVEIGPVRIDADTQLQFLQPRTLVKKVVPRAENTDPAAALSDEVPDDASKPETLGTQISNPGWPSIGGGGWVWSAGLTLTVHR